LSKLALDSEPRIMLDRATANSIAIVPYQMQAGEEKVVAERLYALLSKPPKVEPPAPPPAGEPVSVAGIWEFKLEFVHGSANHKVMFEQNGGRLTGTHEGEFASGDLSGMVAANRVQFRSSLPTEGTRVSFQFEGTEQGGKLAGTVLLGEYGSAKWTAQRHQFRAGGRRG
jgi:D-glucosaminate-6-phosphate ammonia-lyase